MNPSPDSVGSLGRWIAGLVLLGVLPLFLRLWPIEHGAPHPEYVPDTHVVRGALGMAQTKDLAPPAKTFSTYPYGLAFVLMPVYAVDFVAGKALGQWSSGEEYGDRLRQDPWRAHVLARVVFAVLSALTPVLIFRAARAAGLGVGAWAAGWLSATCLLHVHLSLMERPWAPMMTALAATVWASVVHVQSGSRRSLFAAAACAGAAGTMHQAGMGFLGVVGIAWFLAPRPGGHAQAIGRGILAVALFVALVVVIGHPYVLVHGFTDSSGVAGEDLRPDELSHVSIGGQQFVFALRWATFASLARTFVGYDPVLLLFGLVGLIGSLRRRALLPPALFALLWAALFMTNVNDHVRYLLPLAVLLTLPAGYAIEHIFSARPLRLATVFMLALPAVQAMRLGVILRAEDTRNIAAAKLTELPPDARIGIDVYGPIVLRSRAALETTASLRDLYSRESFRLAQIVSGADEVALGIDAIRLEDVFEYDQRHGGSKVRDTRAGLGATATQALDALGLTHVLLVDRTPDDGRPPLLIDPTPSIPNDLDPRNPGPVPKLAPLANLGDPIWTIHPAWGEPDVAEADAPGAADAHLPTELSFPLRDLWRVERPGPKLQLLPIERP